MNRAAGCTFCDAAPVVEADGNRVGCKFCGPPPMPGWFGAGTATQRANVLRGLHPMGDRLGPDGSTCGECVHLSAVEYHDGRYLKCAMVRSTRGPGTDIRRKWRGCRQFRTAP